jgi:hypothetical protein
MHLMLGTRKAVCALDVAQIPVLEHGVNAITRRRKNINELGPPAHSLACLDRRAQPFLRGQPPGAVIGIAG